MVNVYTYGLGLPGGIGGLLRLNQSGANYSYLFDGKGNVTALLDGSASVAAAYQYDPFGQPRGPANTLSQPMQFSTKPYDDKTGLSYYGYRFYVPSLGRWLTRDPIGEEGGNLYGFVDSVGKLPFGGTNLYTFVDNNPIYEIDPDGLQPRTPRQGPPNSTAPLPRGTKRMFGPDGKACLDIDPPHTPKHNPNYHFHRWLGPERLDPYGNRRIPQPLLPPPSGGGGGGGGCFVKGTTILTINGPKSIEEVSINDILLTKNESSGLNEYKKVTKHFQAQSKDIMELVIGESLLKVTPKHRFFVKDKGWTEARILQKADIIESSKIGYYPIIKDLRANLLEKPIVVYNLEIEDNHNYYVSSEHVLAHNLKDPGSNFRTPTGSCFIGSTLIPTRTGLKTIKDINIGDEVKTINNKTSQIEYQQVVKKYGAEIQDYFRVNVGSEEIYCSGNHKFWIIGRGWIKTNDLTAGDKMYSEKGPQKVQTIMKIRSLSPIYVYNIEVIMNENYLVGENGYLVVDRSSSNNLECLK